VTPETGTYSLTRAKTSSSPSGSSSRSDPDTDRSNSALRPPSQAETHDRGDERRDDDEAHGQGDAVDPAGQWIPLGAWVSGHDVVTPRD